MSKIVKNGKLITNKISGFRIPEKEEKEVNDDEDDIQNIEHLDVAKSKQLRITKKQPQKSFAKKTFAQDISLMVEEEEEQAIPNQARKHNFKAKIRNKGNSSDSEELMRSSSNDSIHKQSQQQQKKQKQQTALTTTKQPSQPIQINIKSVPKHHTSTIQQSKLSNTDKLLITSKNDKTLKKPQNHAFEKQKQSELEDKCEDEKSKIQQQKTKQLNEKENVKNGNYGKKKANNLSINENKPTSNIVNMNELFDLPKRREETTIKIKIDNLKKMNKEREEIMNHNSINQVVEEEQEYEDEQEYQQIGNFLNKQSLKNSLNNSFQDSDCYSMQPQGANSSHTDIKSMSIGNLAMLSEDDSLQSNYDNLPGYASYDEIDMTIPHYIKEQDNQQHEQQQQEEESDHIHLKLKKNIKKDTQMIEEDNKHKEMERDIEQGEQSDKNLGLHKNIDEHITAAKDNKPSLENRLQKQQENSIKNTRITITNNKSSRSNLTDLKKGSNELKVNETSQKNNNMRNEGLQDVGSIEEELFEIIELPKDKIRVLWILNSVHFIERLTNNEQNLEGQEIDSQNGKKWILEISYSESQQQIECLFRRKNKLDTSKQQMYYVFKFYAISKTEPMIDRSQNGNKTFSPESTSLSFTFPLDIELILDKYQHIIFELTLTPIRIQHYNSKEETNYVGLLNEGQTCYMNSYLQTLFHIKAFVKLVYSIPTEKEAEPKFPHSLQVLFYQLQSRGYHCTTTELLESFSWDRSKARIQQDVQEFSCLFIEFLESKAEKIPQLKGQIKHLFQGKIQNYIKCIDVDYESVREELFFEISLNLKGCDNIYESLDDYVKEELLEGDNKYDTGDRKHMRQDAKKGIKILELPPVLFFHLKRFEFDYQSGRNMKIIDQHEYYEEIDMQKYVANPSKKQCYKYKLFAVLVHSGDMSSSGHYYAYIRPNPKENNWFKFNDAIVEKASKKQVLDHSFGGKSFFKGFDKNKKQLAWESTSINSTAYMLVYINQKELDNIVGEIPLQQVPKWVIEQEDQLIQEHLLRQRLSKVVEVRMTSFDLLKKQQQSCAVYFQKQTIRDEFPETNEGIIYKQEVDKSKTYKEFYSELCQQIGVEQEDIAIWKIDYLSNGFEVITNQTKKMSTNGSDLIEKTYFNNQTNSANSLSSSSFNSPLSPVLLIIPISNIKFGSNKTIFQSGQDGQLEVRKQSKSNGEKRTSSSNDWNKYFQFQEGSLMLIIIKNFEYTKEGVKIQFMDYTFINPESSFAQLCEEIKKKKGLEVGQSACYKEEKYSVSQLKLETHGSMHVKNVFNSCDCGVIVIQFESKLAKDNHISITNYYAQLEDLIRVRFISSPTISNPHSLSIVDTALTSSLQYSSLNSNTLYNHQPNPLLLNHKLSKTAEKNSTKKQSITNPFLPGSTNNFNESNGNSTSSSDSIQFIQNFSFSNLVPLEGIQFEKIFQKNIKYSQLQMNLFSQLKEYFREQLKQIQPQQESPNSMESEENVKSSTLLTTNNNNNNNNNNQSKKQLQNMNQHALIEQFLNLNDTFYEYIYFKCKIRKKGIDEIPYFQSSVSETSLTDLLKHFDNTIVIHFDFSKALRARDRDQKLIIDYSLYSNTFNKIYPNLVIDIEKTANIQALSNLLKSQKFFRDFLSAEASQQPAGTPAPSSLKVCQLWKDNPNRIELYYQDSSKLIAIKQTSLIRIEIQREIQESEILFICHQTSKNGVETFDNPFSFPLSIYKQVKELKNRVVNILSDRVIIFDGKKVEVNKDNLNIRLYSEYSKYDSKSLPVEESNEKLIKNEIDTDSFKHKCAFLEIQHSSIVSSADSKAIKFDIN